MVPRSTNLELESMNGGITISGVHGNLDFETLNGGINLVDVGGQVRGRTTNGGVSLEMSEGYRATLQTGTVNGQLHTDIPITVRGRLRSNRITTELNGGGATIRAVTTNGSVRIRTR
jgi:DUF4097 and DUF4098 domain-containing protein YvlB